MKKIFALIGFLLLVGCSSQDLGMTDLKETYQESFANPIESLSEEQQSTIGLPKDIPFSLSSVGATTEDNQVQIEYQSDSSERLLVTTIFQPGNILQDLEQQLNLNSGAVAGAEERNDSFYMEWYNGDQDVIYQVEYFSSEEDRAEQTLNIANSI
ncbi:hypothetical protein H0266_16455 [Halobacillus locisalis]|uniref:DUF4367 domain-containing protein n=1 Tax=Halobacillus locisalis TaxID=220753 RepID=A0A838CWG6_9BACI|nr:hypothetical protein [Halobacillus locisalis]MBA2176492.1 hypothetical protein [Halobacillus locisalis]